MTTVEKPEPKTRCEERASDARIEEVVQVIVNNFHGDPAAFFESIKAKSEPSESEDHEASAVRRFVKTF